MTDFFYLIADFSQMVFRFMEKIQGLPNRTFMALGFVAFVIWIKRMAQYNKEAEEAGTSK